MNIIQKLQNWFTKSNESSKERLTVKIKILEEKLSDIEEINRVNKQKTEMYCKELSELKIKYKFLLRDHALMEDRYKDFSHLLCLPFAIRQNMIADYRRSYLEAVNYVGGTHVFKS